MKKALVLLIACFCFTSCIPIMAGSMMYSQSKKNQSRQQFLAELNKTNAEREKNKLQPLDTCAEMKNFDPKWAKKSEACRVWQ